MNLLALGAKYFYNKRYIYYNNGIAPAYTFHKFHEKVYIEIFRFLSNVTTRYADEVVSISKYLSDILKKKQEGAVGYSILPLMKEDFINMLIECIYARNMAWKTPDCLICRPIKSSQGR